MVSRSDNTNPSKKSRHPSSKFDDLTVVSGIGKARQEWLRNTFQVKTLHDLAKLSPDEIEMRLKDEGQIVSRPKIEAWLNEARRLAQLGMGGANREHGWKPIAQFVVEFQEHRGENDTPTYQTHVHHMEADKSATWPGFEQANLCSWMVQQLGDLDGQLTAPPETMATTASETLATVTQRFQELLAEMQATVQSTASEQPASSERFQRLLAKVQGAESIAPAPPPAAIQTVTPAASNERFQRLLAKVQGIESGAAAALTPAESHERFQRLLAKVQGAVVTAPNLPLTVTQKVTAQASSERFLRLLAKAQAQNISP